MTAPSPSASMSDAAEYGRHARAGGSELGLMVARSTFSGKTTDAANADAVAAGKMSISGFATAAGVSANKVRRHRVAWDSFVISHREAAGKIEPKGNDSLRRRRAFGLSLKSADELVPGETIDFEEAVIDALPPRLRWEAFYRATVKAEAGSPGDIPAGDGFAGDVLQKALDRSVTGVKTTLESLSALISETRQELSGDEAELAVLKLREEVGGIVSTLIEDLRRALVVVNGEEEAQPAEVVSASTRVLAAYGDTNKVFRSLHTSRAKHNRDNAQVMALLRGEAQPA